MTKTIKTKKMLPLNKKDAKNLLSLRKSRRKSKIPRIPKTLASTAAFIALLLHKRLNWRDENDGGEYPVEILCSFLIGKKKMALVHFVGYSTDYDRIIPISSLRNL